MKIYLGADHRGYKLKEKTKAWLERKNYNVVDHGALKYDKDDDYTLYAEKVASVVADEAGSLGILFCGSGVGVDVTANKLDGVRASIGKEPAQVKAGRADDDMNVLVIAADFTDENESKNLIQAFLSTDFDGKARHLRRLADIKKIEENN